MKLTLLIAEDEKVERKALRLLVSRSFPDLTILDDAVNGIDLLRKVEEHKPDIVITDIEMPGLNGLEAMEALKQKGFDGKLIVQTAYSQFEYARHALSLDAGAYLLKPIKKEKLVERLEVMIGQLQKERHTRDEYSRVQSILSQMRPLLDQEVISAIQLNEIKSSFLKPYLRQVMSASSWSVMIMGLRFPEWDSLDSSLPGHEEFAARLKDILEMKTPSLVGFPVNDRLTILLGHKNSDVYKTRIDAIETAEYVLKEWPELKSFDIQIGLGRSYDSVSDIHLSYKESLIAFKSGADSSGIYHFGDRDPQDSSHQKLPVKNLLETVLTGKKELSLDAVSLFTENEAVLQLNLPELKDQLLEGLIEINRELSAFLTGRSRQVEILKSYLDGMAECRTKEQILDWFRQEMEQLISLIDEQNRKRIHSSVVKAGNYMENNYMKDISLEIVAEEIGVSPYHLSHLFKQELNSGYKKYLTEIRLKQAVRLMESGRYALDELARLCGFNNPAYFARVFQKQTDREILTDRGYCRLKE